MATALMIFGAFGATLVATDVKFRTRSWVYPTILTLGVVLASTSTTGYVGLVMMMILLGMRQPGKVAILGLLGAFSLAIILALVPEVREVAYDFTFGKSSSSSYIDRTATVWRAFDLFLQRPLLGWGWGTDFSYSIVSIMLSNTGMIGTAVFALAFGGTVMALRGARSTTSGDTRLQAYALAAENALIVYLAQNAVSGFKGRCRGLLVLLGFGNRHSILFGGFQFYAPEVAAGGASSRNDVNGLLAIICLTGPPKLSLHSDARACSPVLLRRPGHFGINLITEVGS